MLAALYAMTTVLDMQNRLRAVNVQDISVKSIKQTDDDLIKWQKEQLFSGKNATGGFIRPPYKPTTKRIKRAKGQPTDRVTLKDTGNFYDGVIVDIGTEVFNVTSEDNKTDLLTRKYKPTIFGLNKISRAGYVTDIWPVFKRNIENATGLKVT